MTTTFEVSTGVTYGGYHSIPSKLASCLFTDAIWRHQSSMCADHRVETSLIITLLWCHNGLDCVSNHQPHECLVNRSFGCRSRKHQSSASLAFVWGIHRRPVNSPHKWPVTRKIFPFVDVIIRKRRDYIYGKWQYKWISIWEWIIWEEK